MIISTYNLPEQKNCQNKTIDHREENLWREYVNNLQVYVRSSEPINGAHDSISEIFITLFATLHRIQFEMFTALRKLNAT